TSGRGSAAPFPLNLARVAKNVIGYARFSGASAGFPANAARSVAQAVRCAGGLLRRRSVAQAVWGSAAQQPGGLRCEIGQYTVTSGAAKGHQAFEHDLFAVEP